ncbi:MAG: prolyl oligopeptidase family serine peptidase [Clostridia bacterium]|nr:prolyl oligopeptidase family serine peptidase [Clostridia bacterium]
MAETYNFHLLLPEFRGKNCIGNPELKKAMGSEYAKSDIKEAIDYVLEREKVDRDNIFLLGLSGGGHMALLMAGMIPEYFKAVGAAVPIVDLARWAEENPRYGKHVYACCGTDREEMLRRSPIAYLDGIARANVKLFHGKRDPVVPASHSLELFHRILEKYPDARVYLDIFDGTHEIDMKSATHWIMTQYKKTSNTEVTG